MALDSTFAKNLNDFIHGTTAAPTVTTGASTRKMKLITTAAGSVSCSAANTEVTGGSYTAGGQVVAFSAATTGSGVVGSQTASQASNSATVNYTGMPATTVTAIELWDTSGTPVRIEVGLLSSSKTTAAGDTLSFSAAAITSSLS